MSKSARQVEREAAEGAYHDEPSTPAAEHVAGPIIVTDSESGETWTAVPNSHGDTVISFGDGTYAVHHGDTVISFGDGTYAVHIGDGVYRECRLTEETL